jgi:hypothetical protein
VNELPQMPKASDYDDVITRNAFKRGQSAARRYYKALDLGKSPSYTDIIERADARDERSSWYDGFNSIANPGYFAS